MSLFPRALECLVGLHSVYKFKGPVISLGVIDTVLNILQVEPLIVNMGLEKKPRKNIRTTTTKKLIEIGLDNAIHGESIMKAMGIEGYDDIDFNSEESPSIVHDLNKTIPNELKEKYELVLDCGTLEHILNIGTTMENIVNLLKIGGYVFHCNPMNNNVNHGFFQFSPTFFKDFYNSNGFNVLHQYVLTQENDNWRSLDLKNLYSFHSKIKCNSDVGYWLITFAKKEENGNIKFPLQTCYRKDFDMIVKTEAMKRLMN